jgi:undecaprenyl-diphosphatase
MARARSIGGPDAFRQRWRDLSRHPDFRLYLAVFAAAVLVLVFIELADEVREPGTIEIDKQILLALREGPSNPVGPPWVERFWVEITTLGSVTVLGLVSLIAGGCLIILRRFRMVVTLLAAVLGGSGLSALLKVVIARPRPDVVEHLTVVSSLSFPSGHSMMSAVVYPALGAILARATPHPLLKLYIIGVALALTAIIGISRVYIGVHYPTDVIAGWCVGSCWALVCWVTVRLLQRRGTV